METLSDHEEHQLRNQRGATRHLGWVYGAGMQTLEFVFTEPLQCNPLPQFLCGSGPWRLSFPPEPHVLSAQHCELRP